MRITVIWEKLNGQRHAFEITVMREN